MGVAQTIINQIPPHAIYLEPFLGSGAVFRAKRPAQVDFGLDVDPLTVEAFVRETGVPQVERPSRGRAVACGCALEFLERYEAQGGEFAYVDPPYLLETRRSSRPIYRCEFAGLDQHERLLELVARLPFPVALSGYPSELYGERLPGWRCLTFETMTRGGAMATEALWMNYPEPQELHDYRFLGRDRIERQRIKRKRERWRARLTTMPTLERWAILAAIQDWQEHERYPRDGGAVPPGAILPEGMVG
ncbi:MAG: DNA adenine methylase [Anaerolineae bacterium]